MFSLKTQLRNVSLILLRFFNWKGELTALSIQSTTESKDIRDDTRND